MAGHSAPPHRWLPPPERSPQLLASSPQLGGGAWGHCCVGGVNTQPPFSNGSGWVVLPRIPPRRTHTTLVVEKSLRGSVPSRVVAAPWSAVRSSARIMAIITIKSRRRRIPPSQNWLRIQTAQMFTLNCSTKLWPIFKFDFGGRPTWLRQQPNNDNLKPNWLRRYKPPETPKIAARNYCQFSNLTLGRVGGQHGGTNNTYILVYKTWLRR